MLEVSGLQAAYGDTTVIHGIDLTVDDGARIAILGRNGAGKSTLLKSLMNAGPICQGQVRWNGMDLAGTSATERSRMGLCLVPEDRHIFPNLTVTENLRIGQTAASRRDNTIAARRWSPEALVAHFPLLGSLGNRMGNQLSGGQQQMLAIARGFASSPRLMLLDEPTEGLAPIIVSALASAVNGACDSLQAGLLLCEQSIAFARRCTTWVMVIDAGQIVFRGDWPAFDADESIRSRYLAV